jgi:glycosyltransferase involved in cell wall biosynthesis
MGERPRPEQRRAAAAIPGVTLVESAYKLEWMDDPWSDVEASGDWLLRLERDVRPDVVHLNGYVHASLPWQAPCLVVAHSCVFSWWAAVFGHAPPPAYDRYRREVTAGLVRARRVVAPTRSMLRALEKEYVGIPHGVVVPNGLAGGGGFPARKEALFFAAGRRWDRAKNLDSLVDASRWLTWPVVIAGSEARPGAPEAENARSRGIQAAGAEGGVRWLGWVDPSAVDDWMARAAVYVSPSRYEPFGLGALEAALRGCALVVSDIESFREVWGDSATFVSPDDPDALGHVLGRLAEDVPSRMRLARAAFARARTLSAKAMAARYSALYGALLSEPRLGRTSAEDACA